MEEGPVYAVEVRDGGLGLLRVSYAGRVAQAEEFGWLCAGTMRQALVLAAPGLADCSIHPFSRTQVESEIAFVCCPFCMNAGNIPPAPLTVVRRGTACLLLFHIGAELGKQFPCQFPFDHDCHFPVVSRGRQHVGQRSAIDLIVTPQGAWFSSPCRRLVSGLRRRE